MQNLYMDIFSRKMSEGKKSRHWSSSTLSLRGFGAANGKAAVIDEPEPNVRCNRIQSSCQVKNRRATKVLSELPKNQIKQKNGVLKSSLSKSNSDLSRGTGGRELGGKIASCENVSRVKTSKIPRATCGRKCAAEASSRSLKLGEAKISKKQERTASDGSCACWENGEGGAGTSAASDRRFVAASRSAEAPALTEDCQKILLGKSNSCDSKRSSDDFDESFEPISDDESADIAGDVTIRREALDIAVKLASRTHAEIEESSALGFPELAMLDILGASDLNLNVPKNELSFTIFEDMDSMADASSGVVRGALTAECEGGGPAAAETEPVASARSPSPIEELPLSSRTPNAPASIITSINSIMSLDTGYQGDGELSRPESRSAEVDSRLKMPHTEGGVQVKCLQFDDSKTMTDSDFFTESDADVHDDLSAAAAEIGSGKGDRKAQVIDGTLYGGVTIHKNGFPHGDVESRSADQDNMSGAFVSNGSNDDMASSGIFSDLEKKPEEGSKVEEDPVEAMDSCGGNVEMAPDYATSEEDRKGRSEGTEGMVKSSSAESSSTIQEVTSAIARTSSNVSIQDSERAAQKWSKSSVMKNKMPNRNVSSKVKVLIESSKAKTEARPKAVRKGKWDAVMDRIAQGKEENKYGPARFRDVKSKVYQSTKPLFGNRNEEGEEAKKSAASSVQSKTRSRRNVRIRSSDSPLVSAKTSRKVTSPNSSQRSSISDISVSVVNKQKAANDTNQNGITGKSASTTLLNAVSTVTNNNSATGKHKAKTIKMVQKKCSPLPSRSKDVQQKTGAAHARCEDRTQDLLKQVKHNSAAFESFAVLLGYCIDDLEAFSTPYLKQKLETEREKYLKSQLRLEEMEQRLQEQIVNKMHIINELEKENRTLISKTEELRLLVEDVKSEGAELRDKLNAVEEELEAKTKEKEEVEEELRRENRDLIYRIEEANKLYSVLKKLYDKIKLELIAARETNAKLDMRHRKDTPPDGAKGECGKYGAGDVAPDRLESEVESLRQVLALKTDEVSELRRQELLLRESADRVPKLVSTITLLEGKVEDFQSQLSSQTEANRELEKRNYNLEEELKSTNVQKLRLTQKNEELQYKLRQYAEALRQLVSEKNLTEDDIRNVYLYPKTPHKGECSLIVDPLPAQMKGVVQKSDSVSYMLEMTEDSSEIVTNIIRRAESMRYASRSQTLPKNKRPKTYSVSSMDTLSPFEDYISSNGDKPCSSSTKFPFHKDFDMDASQTPKSKMVKLHPNDFIPDSIELTGNSRCEIIEITKSFDETGKSSEIVNEMSCSSCSSSSDNGNHFDIESDVYSNAPESDEARDKDFPEKEADLRIDHGYMEKGGEEVSDFDGDGEIDSKKEEFSSFGNVPKTSGGEALIMSSDDARSCSP